MSFKPGVLNIIQPLLLPNWSAIAWILPKSCFRPQLKDFRMKLIPKKPDYFEAHWVFGSALSIIEPVIPNYS